MRPLFRWFGSKWQMAKHYGPPRSDLVIEPFAGSAGYSVYWQPKHVILYDLEDRVVKLWEWLIGCSVKDIMDLPDWIESPSMVLEQRPEVELLMTCWMSFGRREKLHKESSMLYYNDFVATYRDGAPPTKRVPGGDTSAWGPGAKRRLIRQKPLIDKWKVVKSDYKDVDNTDAHWFIDPPYQSQMKVYNKDDVIDYKHLADWSKSRNGPTDVCEQIGADWLPFEPLRRNISLSRKHYTEVVWSSDNLGRLL